MNIYIRKTAEGLYHASDDRGRTAASFGLDTFLVRLKAFIQNNSSIARTAPASSGTWDYRIVGDSERGYTLHARDFDLLAYGASGGEIVDMLARRLSPPPTQDRLLSKLAYCAAGHLENGDYDGYLAITNAITYAKQE